MNGAPTGLPTPSIVTMPSSITSSSALCVFGLARLISSASTIEAKIGPGWKVNWPFDWSKICTPVTSEGSRSGVNWMREVVPSSVLASAFASTVLPVPGTSSSSTWPSETSAVSTSLMTCRLPTIALSTFATSF